MEQSRDVSILDTAGTETIRVAIVDEHRFIYPIVGDILLDAPDIDLVWATTYPQMTSYLVANQQPNVLLTTFQLPDRHMFDLIDQIRAIERKIRILSIIDKIDNVVPLQLLQSGVIGCLLCDESPASVVAAIRLVAQGGTCLSAPFLTSLTQTAHIRQHRGSRRVRMLPAAVRPEAIALRQSFSGLTRREHEVLQYIIQGRTNQEIADLLSLAKGTVQNCVSTIYSKLGVDTRTELIARGWAQHPTL